jgi:hypothetical protein
MSDQMILVLAIMAAVAIVVFLAAFLHSRRASRERGSLFGPDYERIMDKLNRSHGEPGAASGLPLRR